MQVKSPEYVWACHLLSKVIHGTCLSVACLSLAYQRCVTGVCIFEYTSQVTGLGAKGECKVEGVGVQGVAERGFVV